MMTGPFDAPPVVLHLCTGATLPIALILKTDSLRGYGLWRENTVD